MAKISADYLLRLLDDETKDNEILSGYMKYYMGLKEGSKYNLQDNNKQKHIDLNMHRSSSYE